MLGNIFVRRVTGDIVVLPPLRNDNWVIIELISIVGQINKLKCIFSPKKLNLIVRAKISIRSVKY